MTKNERKPIRNNHNTTKCKAQTSFDQLDLFLISNTGYGLLSVCLFICLPIYICFCKGYCDHPFCPSVCQPIYVFGFCNLFVDLTSYQFIYIYRLLWSLYLLTYLSVCFSYGPLLYSPFICQFFNVGKVYISHISCLLAISWAL